MPKERGGRSEAAATNPAAETALLGTAARSNLAELRPAALRAKAAADPDPDATMPASTSTGA